MRLEWFRHHKQFVYMVLLPATVLGLAMFGASGRSGGGGINSGPSIVYTVGDKTTTMAPGEVINRRIEFYKFSNRTRQPDSESIGKFQSEVEYARQLGFEVGNDEMKKAVRQTIEDMVHQIEREAGDVTVDNETYTKLLQQLELSRTQFESIVHDIQMSNKMNRELYTAVNASDAEMFVQYCAENENVRIRYKTLKSEDFLKDVKAPTDEEIKKFYTENTTEKAKKDYAYHDILFTEQTLSAEVFASQNAKLFDLKPTEAELKKFYDDHKYLWKELPKADEKKDAKKDEKKDDKAGDKKDEKKEEPKDTFQPFEKVKADVETRWKIEETNKLKKSIETQMSTAKNDLVNAEKQFAEDKANAGKTFDVAAWAKSKNLVYWVTDELTKEQFDKGKNEINAKDFREATTFFQYISNFSNLPADQQVTKRKQMEGLTAPAWLDQNKPESGITMLRTKTFKDERMKTEVEAKDKIVEHLKNDASIKLANRRSRRNCMMIGRAARNCRSSKNSTKSFPKRTTITLSCTNSALRPRLSATCSITRPVRRKM